MKLASTRRRFVAALAAMGATGLLPSLARAETQSCIFRDVSGSYAAPANVFEVTGTSARFGFLARIRAIGDGITLFSDPDRGGIATEQLALVKGTLTRGSAYDPLFATAISFETPLTALARGGQYYGIVQLAFDQGARVGVLFHSDGQQVGGFELVKGRFDPNSREIEFSGTAAEQLYGWLRSESPFTMTLVVGQQTYSELSFDPGAFASFVDGTLVPRMSEMAMNELAGTCGLLDDGGIVDPTAGCFLTTACCSVVGLADDCWELATLRRFRDGWMSAFAAGRADVARYYREAPAVARRLSGDRAGRTRLLHLYWRTILPSALLARIGANRLAYRLYRRMMLDLLPA